MAYATDMETFNTKMTALANSIRSKSGTSGTKTLDQLKTAVDGITTAKTEQTKSVTPSESAQTVTPDSGKTLSSVSVGAISNTYVGSGIAKKSSSDLTASGATITAPAGYYSAAASKSVASGSAATPATTKLQSAPTFSLSGTTLTANVAATSVSVTPTISAGYISSGTAGTITMSANSSTYTIPTQTKTATANGTITPDSGKFLSSVTVNLSVLTYHTGSGDPPSSLGNNGDLYIDLG